MLDIWQDNSTTTREEFRNAAYQALRRVYTVHPFRLAHQIAEDEVLHPAQTEWTLRTFLAEAGLSFSPEAGLIQQTGNIYASTYGGFRINYHYEPQEDPRMGSARILHLLAHILAGHAKPSETVFHDPDLFSSSKTRQAYALDMEIKLRG